jgi:hypothetical protein
MPNRMARERCAAGRPAAARPIRTALSPEKDDIGEHDLAKGGQIDVFQDSRKIHHVAPGKQTQSRA